jgi:signal transduction histidine kinase
LPPARGVARRLEQVFVNIYLNAAQAFPEEQSDPTITVRAQVTENTVEIEVSDNGKGIADEARERIFDPFFTMRPNGSGLFICKDILLQSGGTIRCESEAGRGTRMIITLVRAEPAA